MKMKHRQGKLETGYSAKTVFDIEDRRRALGLANSISADKKRARVEPGTRSGNTRMYRAAREADAPRETRKAFKHIPSLTQAHRLVFDGNMVLLLYDVTSQLRPRPTNRIYPQKTARNSCNEV